MTDMLVKFLQTLKASKFIADQMTPQRVIALCRRYISKTEYKHMGVITPRETLWTMWLNCDKE